MAHIMRDKPGAPKIVDRSTFHAELDASRVREKAHTHEGDAIAAARRRLPMVQMDGATALIGQRGAVTLLDALRGAAGGPLAATIRGAARCEASRPNMGPLLPLQPGHKAPGTVNESRPTPRSSPIASHSSLATHRFPGAFLLTHPYPRRPFLINGAPIRSPRNSLKTKASRQV